MNRDVDIGASRANVILLGDYRLLAEACASGETRAATANMRCRRYGRVATLQPKAARAATFTASCARWRRLAPFAKEITQ